MNVYTVQPAKHDAQIYTKDGPLLAEKSPYDYENERWLRGVDSTGTKAARLCSQCSRR